jgi:hypothetical protein
MTVETADICHQRDHERIGRDNRKRIVKPEPYTREEFDRAYAWMKSWDLIADGATFEDIVDNRMPVEAVGVGQ